MNRPEPADAASRSADSASSSVDSASSAADCVSSSVAGASPRGAGNSREAGGGAQSAEGVAGEGARDGAVSADGESQDAGVGGGGVRAVVVVSPGAQALVQDLGRPGHAHLGVPPSGALDQPALRLANRLVGNAESAAGVELLIGGFAVRAECSCTVAVTGPSVEVLVNGRAAGSHTPVYLAAGDTLSVGLLRSGLRGYLALGGGVAVPAELGSRSTDVLSGIGPAPLRAGDVLALGRPQGLPMGADELGAWPVADELTVPVLLGPRDDWFAAPAAQLATGSWRVSPESNRVGLRLAGPALRRAEEFAGRELPSEPVITGAVQVPANGCPVVFLADHPTTGGYPVIGVVADAALPALAQARPGTILHFRPR